MIPSKVPLGESFNDYIIPGKRYSFKQVIHQQRVLGRKVSRLYWKSLMFHNTLIVESVCSSFSFNFKCKSDLNERDFYILRKQDKRELYNLFFFNLRSLLILLSSIVYIASWFVSFFLLSLFTITLLCCLAAWSGNWFDEYFSILSSSRFKERGYQAC